MDIHTFPSQNELAQRASATPNYMAPSKLPYAVILKDALSPDECEVIKDEFMAIEPYSVPHCNAVTREKIGTAKSLARVYKFTSIVNEEFWGYDLFDETVSWLQTYERGNDYQRHMDGSPGQMRKLTAVIMLTDPNSYSGGNLELEVPPVVHPVSTKQGTIVFFLPWVIHKVTSVQSGTRQTINLGLWGPPFR